ncbi:MAG: YjgN family protein [Planktotalea sp.]|uniref:YjgN family protein n=1 Tax=Planktotalea sp. TaxID=2029877 RepID=UPI003C745E78
MSGGQTTIFKFSGNTKEWFGIWIVNLLLSIITIGIYSAWAKVRTKKYFYGNTSLDGRTFDYHATGGQILKGRLIVIAAIVVFQIIITLMPILGLILLLGLLVAYPWLITRAMMFNARMSSFSNVRFNFVGTVGRAAMVFLLYPILCALTLYTTAPILDRTVKRFSIDNHRLGTAKFYMDAPLSSFYKAAGLALLWIIVVFVGAAAVGGFNILALGDMMMDLENDPTAFISFMISFYAVFFLGFIPAAFIYQALTRNAIYNGTTLTGGHTLYSNVAVTQMFWIALSNMVVVVCTVGLMLPWAQIRMSRYLADHTGVALGGSLDDFVGTQQEATSALGDAYSDIEGIDLGLPI